MEFLAFHLLNLSFEILLAGQTLSKQAETFKPSAPEIQICWNPPKVNGWILSILSIISLQTYIKPPLPGLPCSVQSPKQILHVAYSGIHPSRQLVHAAAVAGEDFEPSDRKSTVTLR